MSFLKKITDKLFNEGSGKKDEGIYAYVRIKRTGEIIRVRMMRGYDISQNDDGGWFCRKLVMGTRGFDQIDSTFYFDSNYNLLDAEFSSGGELAEESDYLEQQAPQTPTE